MLILGCQKILFADMKGFILIAVKKTVTTKQHTRMFVDMTLLCGFVNLVFLIIKNKKLQILLFTKSIGDTGDGSIPDKIAL